MRFCRYSWILVLLVVQACSTEKNKLFNRTYHNTTARFNGYFNAGEVIKESLIDFHTTNKDDYTKILPVFIIPNDETSKSLYAPMDKAILKTSTVIKKHSMPNPEKKANKKEEWCKWIDDNWMVMGMAYFYKREFDDARTRFEYVFKQYQGESIKYKAMLWEAKTYLELGDFINAETYLDRLKNKIEEQTDKAKIAERKKKEAQAKKSKSKAKALNIDPPMDSNLYDDIEMTWADYYLRKKDYTKAEEKLKKSLTLCKDKKQKARLHFILGQLYQLKGDRSAANFQYARVDKLNPEYEMEFYSRIFRALNYEGGSSAGLKRQLIKMSKDEKNKDYLDQIYYALAEIEFKENNKVEGIADLKKSVQLSTTNNRQKGLSYKKLGDIKYDDKKFIQAKMYYDSTMSHLPQTYENYNQVKEKSESLKDLVANLIIIEQEDSLQRLGRMPKAELEKFVDDMLSKQDAEEERKRQAEENKIAKDPTAINTNPGNNSWYFYNQTAMAQGYTDFKKLFGVRKLEDDWRRSDKTSILDISENPENPDNGEQVKDNADPNKRRDDIIKKIPKTETELANSTKNLVDALYNAGAIYNERLKEQKLAVECFNRIVNSYPASEKFLSSRFQLYLIQGNSSEGEAHKNYILDNHPNSEYAKIIRNPNFKKDEALAKKADEKAYEGVFGLYKSKQFENALTACNNIIEKEPTNTMLPHYYFLRALTYGELKQFDAFEKALSETSSKYPKEEVGSAATELLNLVRNRNSVLNASQGKSTYIFEDNVEHFFVLVFTSTMGSVNDAKAKISNFNATSFSLQELKISNNFLTTDDQVVMVKRFDNKQKAMDYYVAFKTTDMLKGLNDVAQFFVITNKNYASLYIEKKIPDYLTFFQENYLK